MASWALCLALVIGGPALATQVETEIPSPAREAPSVKVSTEVVNVLAVVRDDGDHLIPNLNKEDFELWQDRTPESIRYFSRQTDTPLRLGILIDTSHSQGRVLPVERQEAKAFLRQVMRPQNQAFVLRFDRRVQVVEGPTNDKDQLSQAIDRLVKTAPSTHLYDAVRAASELMRKQEGRKVLILLTDGFDTRSHTSFHSALETAQEGDAVIYAIAVADPLNDLIPLYRVRARTTLKKFSDGTGGRVIRVGRAVDMAAAFRAIDEELRSEYLLGYTPADLKHDGGYHRIEVRVRSSKYHVQARRGYYAPAQ